MSGSKVMAVLFQAIRIQTCLVLLDVISELSTTKEENGQYLRIHTDFSSYIRCNFRTIDHEELKMAKR